VCGCISCNKSNHTIQNPFYKSSQRATILKYIFKFSLVLPFLTSIASLFSFRFFELHSSRFPCVSICNLLLISPGGWPHQASVNSSKDPVCLCASTNTPVISKPSYGNKFKYTELLGFWTLSIVRILIVTRKKKKKHDVSGNLICFRPQVREDTYSVRSLKKN
jgi:hypothetical protein